VDDVGERSEHLVAVSRDLSRHHEVVGALDHGDRRDGGELRVEVGAAYARERLCLGTEGLEPITCYRKALDETPLEGAEAVDLCRCAISAEPVQCFKDALRARPDDRPRALRQCSPIAAENLTADCRVGVPTQPGLR